MVLVRCLIARCLIASGVVALAVSATAGEPVSCPCFDADAIVASCGAKASCRFVSARPVSGGGTRDALSCSGAPGGEDWSYQLLSGAGARSKDLCLAMHKRPGAGQASHSRTASPSADEKAACREAIAAAVKRLECKPVAKTDKH